MTQPIEPRKPNRTMAFYAIRRTVLLAGFVGLCAACSVDPPPPPQAQAQPRVEHERLETVNHKVVERLFPCGLTGGSFAVSFQNDQTFQAAVDQGSGFQVTGTVAAPGGTGVSVTAEFEKRYEWSWGTRVSVGSEGTVTLRRGADSTVAYQERTTFAHGSVVVAEGGFPDVSYPYQVPVLHEFVAPPRVTNEEPCEDVFPPLPADSLPTVLGQSEARSSDLLAAMGFAVKSIEPPESWTTCRPVKDGSPAPEARTVEYAIVAEDPLNQPIEEPVDLVDRPDGVQRESTIVLWLRPERCVTFLAVDPTVLTEVFEGRLFGTIVTTTTSAPG